MMRPHASRVALAVAALGLCSPARAQAPSVETESLGDGLYILRSGPGGNVLVSTGPDGTLLVDAQSASVVEAIARAAAAITTAPVRLVVNTHYHEDHIGGNAWFRARGALTLSHDNVVRRAVVDTTIEELGWNRAAAPALAIPMARMSGPLELQFNGTMVRFTPIPGAHTDGDVIVELVEPNVVHVGDIVEVDAYPFIDWWAGGTLAGTIAAVDRLIAMSDAGTRIVPGHGRVVDRVYLQRYRAMLDTMRRAVARAVADGMSLDAVLEGGLTSAYDAERGGARAGRSFVRVLYLGMSMD